MKQQDTPPADAVGALGASQQAIEHHYDVSNEFYALWLDDTMTYTAGRWPTDANTTSLRQAQMDKLAFYAHHLTAAGTLTNLCDIGCGWGGALDYFIRQHGVGQGVGLSLSPEQTAWVETRVANPRITVKLESWADHTPEELYDGIISIEAFEAFAREGLSAEQKHGVYRHFFQRCHQWLKPGAYLGLQTITYGNAEPVLDSFIARDIFPESDLPRTAEIFSASEYLFEIVEMHNDRGGYEKTLRAWLKNLKQNRQQALSLVGEAMVIKYERYLRLCIFMFQTGACDLLRLIFKRIDQPKVF